MTTELQQRLKSAGAWCKGAYTAAPEDFVRDSSPFEAADVIAMQQRKIEVLREAIVAFVDFLEPMMFDRPSDNAKVAELDEMARRLLNYWPEVDPAVIRKSGTFGEV